LSVRKLMNECDQFLEFCANDIVIIGKAGISSDDSKGRLCKSFGLLFVMGNGLLLLINRVGNCQRDDRFGSREDKLRVGAFRGVPFEIGHLAMQAFGKPPSEFFGINRRSGAGKPATIESQIKRALTDLLLHFKDEVLRARLN